MGIALAEALARGLPGVVSDLAVMREVCGEAEAAASVLVSGPEHAARAMDELLRDPALRAVLSARAHARARAVFSPGNVVRRYLSVLEVNA
jgi:glycosyltransferase involved in cell wall biosynthesis